MTVSAFILTYGIPLDATQARQLLSTLPDFDAILKTCNHDPFVRDTAFWLRNFQQSLKSRYNLDMYVYPHSNYTDDLMLVGHVLGRVEAGEFDEDPFQVLSERIANQAREEVQQLVLSLLPADTIVTESFKFRLLPNGCRCCS
eukprot:TRINITY_DN9956_c0_g1_i1.p1 TRINITY_DN9956_c0_g1~~TRINITY_DN9956_c0_g1_i1.p1  ORF type:complete len:143 (-),score=18.42 TRINITY_DN9956_c0_g1_i1:172-600(-)